MRRRLRDWAFLTGAIAYAAVLIAATLLNRGA